MLTSSVSYALSFQIAFYGIDNKKIQPVQSQLSINRFKPYAQQSISKLTIMTQRSRVELESYLKQLGYFSNHVTIQLHPFAQDKTYETWMVNFYVQPGKRTYYHHVQIHLEGSGKQYPKIKDWLAEHTIQPKQPYDANQYKVFKINLLDVAHEYGYFDAQFTKHQLQVNPTTNQANIDLVFDTGARYRFGNIMFKQNTFNTDFLQRYSPFKSGEWFKQSLVRQLQKNLNLSRFFNQVNVQQAPSKSDKTVHLNIQLKPVTKHQYSVGLGYGTDTGFRALLGFKNRYVTRNGNSFQAQIQASHRYTNFLVDYRIPGLRPNQDYLSIGAAKSFIDINAYKNDITSIGINKNMQWGKMNVQGGISESLSKYTTQGSTLTRRKNLVPQALLGFNFMKPTAGYFPQGIMGSIMVTGSVKNPLSDNTFVQNNLNLQVSWPFGQNNRLYSNLSIGQLLSSDYPTLPPQFRYYAGGSNNLRGYEYASLSPRDSSGNLEGGKNMLVEQLDLEHHLFSNYSTFLFLDAGNAFNHWKDLTFALDTGVGFSWKSPVGPLNIALARTLHQTRNRWRISMTIGYNI